MGEKFIAAQLLLLVHRLSGGSGKAAQAALDWANEHRDHLWSPRTVARKRKCKKRKRKKDAIGRSDKIGWKEICALCTGSMSDGTEPPYMTTATTVASILAFDAFDTSLLRLGIAMQRMHRLASLRIRLINAEEDILLLIGILAGSDPGAAAQRVRRSMPVTFGLLEICASRGGSLDLDTTWSFERLLDRGMRDEDQLIEALVGIRQQPSLTREDFEDQRDSLEFLVPLLANAVAQGVTGINVLIHGPPGTGKTEFARTLSAEAGTQQFAVGEVDEDGEEPTRFDRLHALKRAHRLLARRRDSMLLFDEMEDLFAPAKVSGERSKVGSKIFVNRLLESNAVPTIWTSNSIDGIDPAHLRRLSFILKLDHPSKRRRLGILCRVAADEGLAELPPELASLAAENPETSSVARVALRAARTAGTGAAGVEIAARSLVIGMRGGAPLPPRRSWGNLDLDLFDSDLPIPQLVARLTSSDTPIDFSLLLGGPPGTGKTALAVHLADALNRPLLVKRTSDLLSKWVGGTEANIASAFAEARANGAVLLFDEADSLLADRSGARHSWEITQVNEMLTWMDGHELPLIAATNHAARLDPAAMRRFLFKIELRELSEARAARAFERFFQTPPPDSLRKVRGLTPGDFAVVARQCRFGPMGPDQMVHRLAEEVKARPGSGAKIGF